MTNVATLQTAADLSASITAQGISSLVPAGVILAFGGATAPTGWLLCEGDLVSRTTYADLFAAVSIAHGSGDGTTTFALPDYRGRFVRGRANSSANDPDRATRTAANTGGNTADAVGSLQTTQFSSHVHGFNVTSVTTNDPPATPSQILFSQGNTGSASSSTAVVNAPSLTVRGYNNAGLAAGARIMSIQSNGGNETRPLNAYVNYIIKI